MYVFVTGAHGFLGRYVISELLKREHAVFAPSHADLDLMNEAAVFKAIKNHNPDALIHLAAKVGGIGANQAAPGAFIYENLQMGLNVIQACWKYALPKLVNISTVCSYPKHCPVPFKESDLWGGYPEETNAPYGIAKKALMEVCKAYRAQYGCNFITVIPTNLYGPGDNFNLETSHVIPALIRKFAEAKQHNNLIVPIWGTGNASREFLYVQDAAKAIVLATEQYNEAEPMNIGTGEEIKIIYLANLIKEIIGYKGNIMFDASKPDGQPRRCLDVSRMKQYLDFTPTTNLYNGLKTTIDTYTGVA